MFVNSLVLNVLGLVVTFYLFLLTRAKFRIHFWSWGTHGIYLFPPAMGCLWSDGWYRAPTWNRGGDPVYFTFQKVRIWQRLMLQSMRRKICTQMWLAVKPRTLIVRVQCLTPGPPGWVKMLNKNLILKQNFKNFIRTFVDIEYCITVNPYKVETVLEEQ
jgi:hypothetical protein